MTTERTAAKRFYEHAASAPVDGGIVVQLDGRAVKTPMGHALVLPNAALADAVVAEWESQIDAIRPDTMPLTQLAITALDRMTKDRADVVDTLAVYATTDLLCYRADNPDDLALRQAAAWQPLLDWAEETLEAPLVVTAGIIPIDQAPESLAAFHSAVDALTAFELAVLGSVTPMAGSLVLGLAFIKGRLDGEGVIAAAFVDETFQAEHWGEDEEAAARHKAMAEEIRNAERMLHLFHNG